jgi:hypothetical protein
MNILSLGAGMQSTALALMACENRHSPGTHPLVPVYDAVIYCDLGFEAPWVQAQVEFIQKACGECHIPFYILDCNLYQDYLEHFGRSRTSTVPFRTLSPEGKRGKLFRACTLDYKIQRIRNFVRWELLGYQKGQRLRPEDVGAHQLHLGFSLEESRRAFDSPYPLFVNRFPLVEMGFVRADCYRYNLEVWKLDTKASACAFCPFHTNYFFNHLRRHEPASYEKLVGFDQMLQTRPLRNFRSQLFISSSYKRIEDLTPADCARCQTFSYRNQSVWNGF